MSQQDATEAVQASVPEDNGVPAYEPSPEAITEVATPAEAERVEPESAEAGTGEIADTQPDDDDDQPQPNGMVVFDDLGGQSLRRRGRRDHRRVRRR